MRTLLATLIATLVGLLPLAARAADGDLYTGFSGDGRAVSPAELDPGGTTAADGFTGGVLAGNDLLLLGDAGEGIRAVVMDARTGVTMSAVRFSSPIASRPINGDVVGPALDSTGGFYFATSTDVSDGDRDFLVCRLQHNPVARTLALDTNFGAGGCVGIPFDLGATVDNAIDNAGSIAWIGGKLWIGGSAQQANGKFASALAAMQPTGILDTSFSGDGREAYEALTPEGSYVARIAPASNGSLLLGLVEATSTVTGDVDSGVLKVSRTGGVVTSFGEQGYRRLSVDRTGSQFQDDIVGLAETDGGGVIGALNSFRNTPNDEAIETSVFRLTAGGALDTTFNADGYASYPFLGFAVDARRQVDGRLVVAMIGLFNTSAIAYRFEKNGDLSCPYGNEPVSCRFLDTAGQPSARAAALFLASNRPVVVGYASNAGSDSVVWMLDEAKVFENGFE